MENSHIFEISFNKQVENQRIKLDKIIANFEQNKDYQIIANDLFKIVIKVLNPKLKNTIFNKTKNGTN